MPMTDRTEKIDALRHREPGEEADPYEDVDLSTLPSWWQQGIREHRAFDLRPYRPPRFADGTITVFLIDHLEEALDVTIDLYGTDIESDGAWTIEVDKEPVGTIDHYRDPEGYSVYDMTSDAFEALVRTSQQRPASKDSDDHSNTG